MNKVITATRFAALLVLSWLVLLASHAAAGPTGPHLPSQPVTCAPSEGTIICEGSSVSNAAKTYRDGVKTALQMAETIAPVSLPVFPQDLCSRKQDGIPAKSLEDLIANHQKDDPRRNSTSLPPLKFLNIMVFGPLTLHGGSKFGIQFENVVFCGDVTLIGTFEKRIAINNSIVATDTVPGLFDARYTVFKEGIELQALVAGSINFQQSEIERDIDLKSVTFGNLNLSRSQIENLLLPYASQLIQLHDAFAATSREEYASGAVIELTAARVAGITYADRSRVEGGISAQLLQTQTLRIQEARIAEADFRQIRAQSVTLKGSQLGRKDAQKLDPCGEASVLISDPNVLSFEQAQVAGDLSLQTRVRASGRQFPTVVHQLLCLNGVQVGGSLELDGLTATKLDLTGARIGQVLRLASHHLGTLKWHDPAQAALNLSKATLPRLTLSNALALPADFSLSGAQIDTIEDVSTCKPSPTHHTALQNLISKIPDPTTRISALAVLEKTLTALGDIENAHEIKFLRLSSETDAMCWFCTLSAFPSKFFSRLSQWLGGYGFKPERTLGVALGMVVLGAAIVSSRTEGKALLRHRFQWVWGPRSGVFEALLFSLDRIIPLLSFDRLYSEWVFSDRVLRVYFMFHTLIGLLLAGTVVTYVGRSIGLSQ